MGEHIRYYLGLFFNMYRICSNICRHKKTSHDNKTGPWGLLDDKSLYKMKIIHSLDWEGGGGL